MIDYQILNVYRDRRFTILHIIKIFTTDDFTTDFYNVKIFVYWRTVFKHLSNNQLSCSVVCEVNKTIRCLSFLTSDSAITNNRKRRGRPTEMKNHTFNAESGIIVQ